MRMLKQFIVYRTDRTDGKAEEIRKATRPLHAEYMKQFHEKVHFGGPMQNKEGISIGGMMVIDAHDESEVWEMINNDPFEKAALSSKIEVYQFRWQTKRPATLPPL